MKNEKTAVIFRKMKYDNSILALFPYLIGYDYLITSYSYLGQHSSADYQNCIQSSKPAKPNEYELLKKELESIGYNLEIREKRNFNKYIKAYHQSKN